MFCRTIPNQTKVIRTIPNQNAVGEWFLYSIYIYSNIYLENRILHFFLYFVVLWVACTVLGEGKMVKWFCCCCK